MQLPQFQSSVQELNMLQNRWAAILNPLIALPTNQVSILRDIPVVSGANSINHKLGHTPIGWYVIDANAAITLYRSQPFNNLTLTLTASGSATISLVIF